MAITANSITPVGKEGFGRNVGLLEDPHFTGLGGPSSRLYIGIGVGWRWPQYETRYSSNGVKATNGRGDLVVLGDDD